MIGSSEDIILVKDNSWDEKELFPISNRRGIYMPIERGGSGSNFVIIPMLLCAGAGVCVRSFNYAHSRANEVKLKQCCMTSL